MLALLIRNRLKQRVGPIVVRLTQSLCWGLLLLLVLRVWDVYDAGGVLGTLKEFALLQYLDCDP